MNKEEAIKQLKKHKQEIDKQYISSRYSKAIEVVLNLIQKQESIIDKMAEEILKIDTAKSKFEYDHAKVWDTEKGIKEYFKKVVDEDVED